MTDLEKWKIENEGMIAVSDAVSRGEIGHNGAPDPIDEALAPYMDEITESENWLDGELVDSKAGEVAVDAPIKALRGAKGDIASAKKSSTAPLHDAWKAEIARWKPTEEDIARRLGLLAKCVEPFKRQEVEKKEAIKRAAYAEAAEKERIARELAEAANATDYAAQVEVEAAKKAATEAKKGASAANRDKVKGLRTVHKHKITDHRAALHWIAQNDKPAMTAFIEKYVADNCKATQIDGVDTWSEKEAY